MERRCFPRYQLATPLTGIVEQDGVRYSGSVLNISVGGFYLHLSKLPEKNLRIHGADDYGEVHYANRNAFGFGNLVRIEKFANSLGIGFSWDSEGMDEDSSGLLGEVIKEQEGKRALGRVSTVGSDIVLKGHLSSALSPDVFSSLRMISHGQARLSLAECTSIDSSGIDMLMVLRDRGVPIVNAGHEIEAILQRFQLLPSDAEKVEEKKQDSNEGGLDFTHDAG